VSALVVRGDALRLPLADQTVDLIVTSPPYWSLRDYHTGHPAELGSEATPLAWLAALWAATAELARVLTPTGSIWVNLGDAYADRANTGPSAERGSGDGRVHRADRPGRPHRFAVARKSLYGLPWAYALGVTGMLAALGGPDPGLNLILRGDVIWHKPNGLPDSVTDRRRGSHEFWFHLVKHPRYYAATDELREPYDPATHAAGPDGALWRDGPTAPTWGRHGSQSLPSGVSRPPPHPLGKLPGSVWSVPSEPLDVPDYFVQGPHGPTMLDAAPLWRYCEQLRHHGHTGPVLVREIDHYAAFPSEWPRRLILGWSPPGVCTACGHGRRPVTAVTGIEDRRGRAQGRRGDSLAGAHGPDGRAGQRYRARVAIGGYACACTPHTDHPGSGQRDHARTRRGSGKPGWHHDDGQPTPRVGPWREYHLDGWRPPPTRPAVVLDPFCGTGTTVMVARALGRHAIGVDLSADYCQLARWRIHQSGHAAKALARTNLERQATLAGLAATGQDRPAAAALLPSEVPDAQHP
jgi:DNA modification methylase